VRGNEKIVVPNREIVMQKRKRQWLWGGIGIALTLIAATIGIGVALARSRQPFVSKTDPVTGYRCIFTLSRNWKRSDEKPPVSPNDSDHLLDSAQYIASPPTPLQTWIETRFGHSTPSSQASSFDPFKKYMNRIMLVLTQGNTLPEVEVHDGYPDLDMKNGAPYIQIAEQHRYLLDGQPATQSKIVFSLGRLSGANNYTMVIHILYIKVRDKPLYIAVEGFADESHDRAIQAEIDAMRASFRLEKPGK
jgi:hypothetical protein